MEHTLSEDEEHAITIEAWMEYRAREDRAKAVVYTICIAVLTGVMVGCAVPLGSMADCKHDCSLASGLLTGLIVSALLWVVAVCVCCVECMCGEPPVDEYEFNRDAILRLITEKRERRILLKERTAMNEL